MTPKQQILGLLPKLKTAELGEIAIALKALAAMDNISSVMPSGTPIARGDYLIESIAQHLAQLSLIFEGSRAVSQLQHTTAYGPYKNKRPDLEPFLDRLARSLGTKGNRHMPQITFLCAVALADFLKARNILSVGAMLTQIDKIPEALDSAFPGYIEAGMFGFILMNTRKGIS